MPIRNDRELALATERASRLIQEIQDYAGRTLRNDAKVSFPRRLIRTAARGRFLCPGYLTQARQSSCAYGLMYLDVLWWIISRTDLGGIAQEMVLKSAIITLGSILEALLKIPGERVFGTRSEDGLRKRIDEACRRGWINVEDRDELKWLWDRRTNVHLHQLDEHEFGLYQVEHVSKPTAALLRLMSALRMWHLEREKG
jgi:hypothetical protein